MQWTILSTIKWATQYFAEKNIDSPGLTAELLLSHVIAFSRMELYLQFDRPLDAEELAGYKELIRRRLAGEPVAYITGRRGFWSLDLEVNNAVLIPRQDTETLIEQAVSVIRNAGGKIRSVFDLGTGSGAIILSLASEFPDLKCFACDISPDALGVAKKNSILNTLQENVTFFSSDWFSGVSDGFCCDMIVSNPPYIRKNDIPGLQKEVGKYEPRLALDGGDSGLDCLGHIIRSAGQYLSHGGWLLLEMGFDQKEAVSGLAADAGCYTDISFHKDYAGNYRVAQMKKK